MNGRKGSQEPHWGEQGTLDAILPFFPFNKLQKLLHDFWLLYVYAVVT